MILILDYVILENSPKFEAKPMLYVNMGGGITTSPLNLSISIDLIIYLYNAMGIRCAEGYFNERPVKISVANIKL